MHEKDVLISGAGIAGPALAYWLVRSGYRPTIVERAPAPRPGGQTVDLRGAGRTVVERMGLLPAVRDAASDTLVVADGYSCQTQIAQLTGRSGLHTAQVVKMALDETGIR